MSGKNHFNTVMVFLTDIQHIMSLYFVQILIHVAIIIDLVLGHNFEEFQTAAIGKKLNPKM